MTVANIRAKNGDGHRPPLQGRDFSATAFQRTDSALLCICHELEKFARGCVEIHGCRFFDCLSDIKSARVEQFKRAFDFISILRAESSAAQTDHVQSKNIISFPGDHKRWNIFAECRAPLRDGKAADVHVLMKKTTAAQKRSVIDADVTAKKTIVRDNHVVPNRAIVTDMRAGHQKIIVADGGGAPFRRATMDRAMFANDVVVSNVDFRFALGQKGEILRRRADDRAMSNEIGRADRDVTLNYNVRLNGRFFADPDAWPNHRVGSDLNLAFNLGLWVDNRCPMNS